jgi:hypothetical protein
MQVFWKGAPYTPGTTSEYWKTISFPLTSGFQTSGVQFKIWVKAADRTNNFYLDNWNVGGFPTGIENTTDLTQQVTLVSKSYANFIHLIFS